MRYSRALSWDFVRSRRRHFLDWPRHDWRSGSPVAAAPVVGLVARSVHASVERPFSAAFHDVRPHARRRTAVGRSPQATAPPTRPAATAVASLVDDAAVAHRPSAGATSTVRSPARATVRPLSTVACWSA